MGVVTIRRRKSVLAPAGLSGSGRWIEEEWNLGNRACAAYYFTLTTSSELTLRGGGGSSSNSVVDMGDGRAGK